jgi:NADPH-dependent 2,4-dienoyl-CoA reductase/sulfur reductase-like enzyme
MGRVVSERTASGFVDEHRRHGIDVRFGTSFGAVLGNGAGRVRAIVTQLDHSRAGHELPCDVLVVGMGVVPAPSWPKPRG